MVRRVLLSVAVFVLLAQLASGSDQDLLKLLNNKENYNLLTRPNGSKDLSVSVRGVPLNITGQPVLVEVNMFVRFISEINDENRDFLISVTLRQKWTDDRLTFTPDNEEQKYVLLTDASKIWVPDMFFSNEKEGHDHKLMTPNTLIRIKPNGEVLYSTRITLRLSCPMDFTNFPMDKQICSIRMASYAHTTSEIIFKWKDEAPVVVPNILEPSPYHLQGIGNDYCYSKTITGEFSCLKTDFLLKRQVFSYLMHAYLPLGLLVLVSWIIFWLDERSTGVRVLVAVIVFVATVIEGSRVAALAPAASVTKGIDVWVNWILFFVFFTLVEQVVVILISGKGSAVRRAGAGDEEGGVALQPLMENGEKASGDPDEVKEAPAIEITKAEANLVSKWLSRYGTTARKIDVIARILFPVVFLVFNLTYWASYADYEGINSLSSYTKIPYN